MAPGGLPVRQPSHVRPLVCRPHLDPAPVGSRRRRLCPAGRYALWAAGVLRGANVFQGRNPGGASNGIGDGDFAQSDFDDLAAAGANYVQISHAGLFAETPPYALDPVAQANLDNVIDMAGKAGLYAEQYATVEVRSAGRRERVARRQQYNVTERSRLPNTHVLLAASSARTARLTTTPRSSIPDGDFARRLAGLAALLHAGFPIRAVALQAPGEFDTHSDEGGPLADGLQQTAQALAAFQADLEQRHLGPRVRTLLWSEFGRRAEQNDSNGTDHGAAGVRSCWARACRTR